MQNDAAPELLQVLRGLALNRQPGWNFPGKFLELSFDELGAASARLSMAPGPHCNDRDGQVNLGALAVLADIGMAAGMRQQVGMGTRMATVAMSLQLTGAPAPGPLESRGEFDGFIAQAAGKQGLARSRIYAGRTLVATCTGSFMALGNRDATAPLPTRRRGEGPPVMPLAVDELNDDERDVYGRALRALDAANGASFIDRFWGFEPQPRKDGAACDFPNALHVGNRVGHTQGGLTFALAAKTAAVALGGEWRLVGISAWYVSPGTGPMLRAESTTLHQGSLTAVVRSRVTGEGGRLVLEAVTHHARTNTAD